MRARLLWAVGFGLWALSSPGRCAELGPTLSAADEHSIGLALRALKMTEHDLSFTKTNAESELVLRKTRLFLQQPLTLPPYGRLVMSNLQTVTSLSGLTDFARRQLELPPRALTNGAPGIELDPGFLSKLPTPVARAVQRIAAAGSESELLLRQALPSDKTAALAAFAIDALQIDKDKAEWQSWQNMGLDTTKLQELVRRDENLELQDTELADAILGTSDRFDPSMLFAAVDVLARALDEAVADLRTNTFTEEFEVSTDTPLGRIICGGAGHNVYTNEAFLIVDTGGDDTYLNSAGGANGLAGRPISIVLDLAGNDQFISRRSFSQGSGVFGIGILAALGSNGTFQARNLSQGAGLFGCGLLMAGPGNQTFEANVFGQGAAEFGAGILWQRGGDTRYTAAELAQGFGGVQGCGLLLDESGDDAYFAGGKFACGWLPGRYFSLSQGFGEGMRPFAGGGVGILCDLKGNDRYNADVYGQGASYWYSVGLLLDADGNDVYRADQYCQGAGIHLSAGALIDWTGNDQYAAEHICQGAAHDYSVGLLIDRAGNDAYDGITTAQGSAINNSFAMLLDRAGDDVYTGRDPKASQAAGHDGDKREYGSIALLLDLGGHDEYSQGQSNNTVWLKPFYGAGLDCEANTNVVGQAPRLPLAGTTASEALALQSPGRRLYTVAPVDPHQPIEQLMRRAISDKPDAGAAWTELNRRAAEALPYLLTRLDTPNVLVRARTEELVDALGTNSVPALIAALQTAKNDDVARLCCYFLARFGDPIRGAGVSPANQERSQQAGRPFHYDEAVRAVLPLTNRARTRSVAFYTLAHLHAHEAFEAALDAIHDGNELVRLRAAQALGRIGDRRAIPKLLGALDDPMWDVRYAAEDALVGFGTRGIGSLRAAFARAHPRARPHILEALARLGDRRALT
jgi:HEAT repeat protein